MGWEKQFRKVALIAFAVFLAANFFLADGSVGNYFLGVVLGGVIGLVGYALLLFFAVFIMSIRFVLFYRTITAQVNGSLLSFVYVKRFGKKKVETIVDLEQVDYVVVNHSRKLQFPQLEFWKGNPEPYFSYQNLVARNLDAVKVTSVPVKPVQDMLALQQSLTEVLTTYYGNHDFAPLVDKHNWQSLIRMPSLNPYED